MAAKKTKPEANENAEVVAAAPAPRAPRKTVEELLAEKAAIQADTTLDKATRDARLRKIRQSLRSQGYSIRAETAAAAPAKEVAEVTEAPAPVVVNEAEDDEAF